MALGLSWAHSSVDRQLQVEVSQLSAGLGWPRPGQLGQPGLALAGWPGGDLMVTAEEEERKQKWARAFLKSLGLLLLF